MTTCVNKTDDLVFLHHKVSVVSVTRNYKFCNKSHLISTSYNYTFTQRNLSNIVLFYPLVVEMN